jgi:hypothetical protein
MMENEMDEWLDCHLAEQMADMLEFYMAVWTE